MYVCVCNAVTEREVGEAIDGGARTRHEVTRVCGAGGDCGSCHRQIDEMIDARCGKREQTVIPAAALVRERERAA